MFWSEKTRKQHNVCPEMGLWWSRPRDDICAILFNERQACEGCVKINEQDELIGIIEFPWLLRQCDEDLTDLLVHLIGQEQALQFGSFIWTHIDLPKNTTCLSLPLLILIAMN